MLGHLWRSTFQGQLQGGKERSGDGALSSPGSSLGLGRNTGREERGRTRWKSAVCTCGLGAAQLGQMCGKAEWVAAAWTKYTCSPHTCCQPSHHGPAGRQRES